MSTHASPRRPVHLLLALAACLLVVLGFRTQQWRGEVETLRQRMLRPYSGMTVPIVAMPTLSGNIVELGAAPQGGAQVIAFLTTTCPYCVETLPVWKELAREASAVRPSATSFILVSLDPEPETRAYVREHGLGMPVVVMSESRHLLLFRAGRVPQTVVVNAQGRIVHTRPGTLKDSRPALDSLLMAVRNPEAVLVGASPRKASGLLSWVLDR